MVYVLIYQRPLKIQVYSSLVALFEDNDINELGVSKSKLDKWDWNFNYTSLKVIISKRETLSSGDVRRKNTLKSSTK